MIEKLTDMMRPEYEASLYAGLSLRRDRLKKWGYDCATPANYLLLRGQVVDGRKVGCGQGTGMFAAIAPLLGDERGPVRVYGSDVTFIAPASWGKEIVTGPVEDMVALIRRYAREGEFDCYANHGSYAHSPEMVVRLLATADALAALDFSQFPERPTGPLVRRPPHTGHRDGVLLEE